ncbi:MAG TPA: hypothetical protein VFH37_03360 [Candidatus Saccharimonadales bacterium]|nr:hypothetical protein [Candidatus Saccharimonadales bacterium]
MKTAKTKKTGLLMAMLTFFSLAVFLVLGVKQAAAIGTITLSNFKFVDSAHITGDVNGQKITFYDQNPTDGNHNYAPSSNDIETLNQIGLCQGSINNWGVNLKSTNLTASTVKGQVVFGENNGQGNNTCFSTVPSSDYSPSDIINIQNPNSAATIQYMWDSNSGNIIGVTGSPTFTATHNPDSVFINQANNGTCEASGIIVTSSDSAGTLYQLTGITRGGNPNPVPDSIAKYLKTPGSCQLVGNPTKITIGGTKPANPTGPGQGNTSDTASSCTNDATLSWIVCPVVNGLSKSADTMNSFVESQLNFSVKENLSDSVHKAWTIFRTLTSIIIVIVMLVMVFSQAVGGGPFDAYTVRKLLPKLVAAIILMQISWPICIYIISLANDAGQAIGQLMAAPFGGPHALELGALLQRWNTAGAAVVGLVTTGGVIAAIVAGGFLIELGWPLLILAILLIFIAIVVDFAVLLIRNALIVLLVMTAPLAAIAFVMPGLDNYWKKWKENFIRVLFFFPLVIALIYGGRIFAWIVAGLGTPGPLDLIMILAGFFGPYFFLPKAFKWAGPGVAIAADAINKSWPINKSREAAKKGLMERQQRNIDQRAKALDTTKEGYARATKRKFGIPYAWSGNLPRTAVENLAAGRFIPTKRGLAAAVERGDRWKAQEESLDAARVKREQDKGAAMSPDEVAEYNQEGSALEGRDLSAVPYTYSLGKDGKTVEAELSDNATGRGKASVFRNVGGKDEQLAGVAVDRALKTSSWVEIFKKLVPVTDKTMQDRIKASGAEYWMGDDKNPKTRGKMFVRMYDIPRYNSKVNSSEDLYPLPLGKGLLATPHITNPEGQSLQARQERARLEGRDPAKVKPHHIARALSTINGYMDAGNITSQSEAEFEEFARLAKQDPDVSVAFGQLLHRIAHGGQGGINVLTHLRSSASMNDTLSRLLASGKGHATYDITAEPPKPDEEVHIVPHYESIEGYLQEGQRSMAAQANPTTQTSSSSGSLRPFAAPPTVTRFEQSGPTEVVQGPVTQLQHQLGYAAGTVISAPGGQQPVELKIDHETLADTIREASRQGTKQGFNQALRDSGAHRPGDVFRPGGTDSRDDDDEDDENT